MLEQTIALSIIDKIKEEAFTFIKYGNSNRKNNIIVFEYLKNMNILDATKIDSIIRELDDHNVMNYEYENLVSTYKIQVKKIKDMIYDIINLIDKKYENEINQIYRVLSDLSNEIVRLDYPNPRYFNIYSELLLSKRIKLIFSNYLDYYNSVKNIFFITSCTDMLNNIEKLELQNIDCTDIFKFHEIYKPFYEFLQSYAFVEKYYLSRKEKTIEIYNIIKNEYFSIVFSYDILIKCVLSEEDVPIFTCIKLK